MVKRTGLVALLVAVFLLIHIPLGAQQLDTSFGTGGVVTFDNASFSNEFVMDNFGNIYVAGATSNGINGGTIDALILKYKSSGALDTSFGSGGIVKYSTGVDTSVVDIAVDTSGNVYAVGAFRQNVSDVLLLKYTPAGVLDTSFGNGGVVTFNGVANGYDFGDGILLDSAGNIIISGDTFDGTNENVLLLRYTPAGILDATFGVGGVATYNFGGNNFNIAYKIAFDKTGNILAVGETDSSTTEQALLLRFLPNGTLDTTFGVGGAFVYSGVSFTFAFNLAISGTDIFVVASSFNSANWDLIVLKVNTAGALVGAFGTGGVATYTTVGVDNFGNAVTLDSNGNVLATGSAGPAIVTVRFTPKGVLDTTFGTNGVLIYNFGVGLNFGIGIDVDSAGNIFVCAFNYPVTTTVDTIILLKYRPPDNTPVGTNVTVNLGSGVTVVFQNVTKAGNTTVTTTPTGPNTGDVYLAVLPTSIYYDITTTAVFTGTVEIIINYNPDSLTTAQQKALQMYHFVSGVPVNITDTTVSPNPNTGKNLIYGVTSSFSIFAVGIPIIHAFVEIEPGIINLKGDGIYTAFITLSNGHSVFDIDPATVTANGFSATQTALAANKFIAKFQRSGLINTGIISTPGERKITINGGLTNGLPFRGSAIVKIKQ